MPRRTKPVELSRSPPPTLYLAVLKRDRFRCTNCAASPAFDPYCTLHVDHIVPFSKGGRTVLDNLRLLCAHCNQRRGARDAIESPEGPPLPPLTWRGRLRLWLRRKVAPIPVPVPMPVPVPILVPAPELPAPAALPETP